MCVVTCFRNQDGKVEKYSWNPEKRISKAILQKSGFDRLEIWVPEEEAEMMVSKGWKVAKKMDGSVVVSNRGNILLTYPERKPLPTFPF